MASTTRETRECTQRHDIVRLSSSWEPFYPFDEHDGHINDVVMDQTSEKVWHLGY